jgi:uncharacterized protein (TIGR03437 family)
MRFPLPFRSLLTLAAALCAAPLIAPAQTSIETFTYSTNGRTLPIFRDYADVITLAYITVPRSLNIQKVTATVDIDYPRPGDINLYLYSPEGTRTKLLERNCGNDGSLRRITFDDAAPNRYSDACPGTPGGSFRANEPLANSTGQNAAGIWVLAIENNGSDDYIGWLLGASLTVTGEVYSAPTTVPELIVNAASYFGGPIAPGELISIYGTNLGPSTPEEVNTGNLPTTLGGTEVTLNESSAFIRYASKYRVDVQVPYLIGVPGDIWLTVKYGGGSSTPVKLTTQTAKPGLFAVNPSGFGQLEAVNGDGSLNKNEPARRGGEITVFASGLGITLPPVPAGQVSNIRPTPGTYHAVSATVAGVPAEVIAATLAPDRPGVYAVRIRIPLDVPIGPVGLKVSCASSSSQEGAIIHVR